MTRADSMRQTASMVRCNVEYPPIRRPKELIADKASLGEGTVRRRRSGQDAVERCLPIL